MLEEVKEGVLERVLEEVLEKLKKGIREGLKRGMLGELKRGMLGELKRGIREELKEGLLRRALRKGVPVSDVEIGLRDPPIKLDPASKALNRIAPPVIPRNLALLQHPTQERMLIHNVSTLNYVKY